MHQHLRRTRANIRGRCWPTGASTPHASTDSSPRVRRSKRRNRRHRLVTTIVFLHAHPDDECLISGGTIAKYAAAGHRVVLVT
ncbi:MAG: PIG-L deacetylase family protein, partial [Actinomycetota bacterium]